MPNYNFECKKCHIVYDEIVPYDETGKYKTVKCPSCNSKSKTKLLNACSFNFANPEGTDRWNSESTGHDYRFHHNLPKVIAERQAAEEASHVGANVYNPIDDISKASSWDSLEKQG